MKASGLYYVLFVVLVIGGLMFFFKMQREMKKENPRTTDLATEPDELINTAGRNLQDHKSKAAIKFLDDAIEIMKILEKDGDSISINAVEIAIYDLEVVEEHIRAEDINEDMMYEAFADAMNSLAYASLRVSEQYTLEGKEKEAKVTLSHAMEHLQNSIKYARGDQKEDEIKIVAHLTTIIENHLESDISEIDKVMAEIDSVVQSHVIQ
ncbi:MAG: hypothetical protein AAF789_04025 [Bacteroidota bacterium]